MTALGSIPISMSSSTTSPRRELSGLPLSANSLRRTGHTSTLDLNRSTWIVAVFGTTFPTCEPLQRISPEDKEFKYLHAAQLIKHILAMKRQFGRGGFRLLYLWYDVLGEQGKCHQDEVAEFAKVTRQDGIKFNSITYQELITTLANQLRSDHYEYIRYLTERYL
jgi:hypothetical protein